MRTTSSVCQRRSPRDASATDFLARRFLHFCLYVEDVSLSRKLYGDLGLRLNTTTLCLTAKAPTRASAGLYSLAAVG